MCLIHSHPLHSQSRPLLSVSSSMISKWSSSLWMTTKSLQLFTESSPALSHTSKMHRSYTKLSVGEPLPFLCLMLCRGFPLILRIKKKALNLLKKLDIFTYLVPLIFFSLSRLAFCFPNLQEHLHMLFSMDRRLFFYLLAFLSQLTFHFLRQFFPDLPDQVHSAIQVFP